jgi:hypothetical protein
MDAMGLEGRACRRSQAAVVVMPQRSDSGALSRWRQGKCCDDGSAQVMVVFDVLSLLDSEGVARPRPRERLVTVLRGPRPRSRIRVNSDPQRRQASRALQCVAPTTVRSGGFRRATQAYWSGTSLDAVSDAMVRAAASVRS